MTKARPERIWRNARLGPDGRVTADLNGCDVHTNVCDLIRWQDGTEECMICARERQPEAGMQNAAFHMRPYWEWAMTSATTCPTCGKPVSRATIGGKLHVWCETGCQIIPFSECSGKVMHGVTFTDSHDNGNMVYRFVCEAPAELRHLFTEREG